MSLFTPDTSSLHTYEEKGKYVMAWRFSLVFSMVFFTLGTFISFISLTGGVLYVSTSLISLGTLVYLKKTKNFTPVFLLYALAGTLFSHYSLFTINNILHYADLLWILVIVVFAFISISKKAGWTFLFVNLTGVVFFIFFDKNATYSSVENVNFIMFSMAIEIIMIFLILAYLVNQYILFQDYSRLQLNKLNFNLEQQNQAVINQNKENITLIKEVHHRVKNNLQIIISLLRMQRSEIKSEETQEQFSIAINRILTMSMIHQKLYQEKEPSRINITDYLDDLSNELLSVSNRQISLNIMSGKEYTGLKTIVPFGLLVNELISNTLKHAYVDNEITSITIEIKPKGQNEIVFTYEDNGLWVEPKEKTSSFGLELIDILTEQLDGTYSREGSKYKFVINTTEE